MKRRITITIDEDLLEQAHEALDLKTYSDTVGMALARIVQNRKFWESYRKFEKEVKKGDFFWPGYLEEIRPHAVVPQSLPKKRISAHEARAPRKKTSGRGRRTR
jgi:hypothetical protein